MKPTINLLLIICYAFSVLHCSKSVSGNDDFFLEGIFIGNMELLHAGTVAADIPIDQPIELVFNVPVNRESANESIHLLSEIGEIDFQLQFAQKDQNIRIIPTGSLAYNSLFTLSISSTLKSVDNALFVGLVLSFRTKNGNVQVKKASIDGELINSFSSLLEVSLQPSIEIEFSLPMDTSVFEENVLLNNDHSYNPNFNFSDNQKKVSINFDLPLDGWTNYHLELSDELFGANGEYFEGYVFDFYTTLDTTSKFTEISDEELLTLIQEQTFKYFWDFGQTASGLARERNTSGQTVTFGGSGFGLMAMIVAVERSFITLDEAVSRWKQIFKFLESADRFHGAFPHWMNGETGKVQRFSTRDNGGDLVETAFFIQGLLTVRQYLYKEAPQEIDLIDQIDRFWREVEWDWYTKGENEALYWHWSPEFEWEINLKIRGHNETQIVYILAASSPTHSIDADLYETGYARSGAMVNGKSYYQNTLPLGNDYGGPLFFTHYSYLGLDPRNLQDKYANYWIQNINHSKINYAYCVDNPKNFVGYSADCWGLTASDGNNGYSAHHPNNDRGVITPTAAISSLPYTPEESMAAIRHFYYVLGDRLWGEYGFYDAFNPTEGWVANSYLAIDQGPIICMIENYRTGLLWELFMSAPEIKSGLDKLEINY